MGAETVFILGAGFSKAAGLPGQAELSAAILSPPSDTALDRVITTAIREFLHNVFGWQEGDTLPSLEDIFTSIDLSANTGHFLGHTYSPKMLRALRRMLIYRTLSTLDVTAAPSQDITHILDLHAVARKAEAEAFVVLNWDVSLERHLRAVIPGAPFDYKCAMFDWKTATRALPGEGIAICKMHGSSNWVYCDNCKSLFSDPDENLAPRIRAGLTKSDIRLFDERYRNQQFDLDIGVRAEARSCKVCKHLVSPHIATFSYTKSFRGHAYPSVWYEAERLLSEASRWIFIGYSLHDADYELKHLMKTAQIRSPLSREKTAREIRVVIRGAPETKERFKRFFGSRALSFVDGGVGAYVTLMRFGLRQELASSPTIEKP